MADFKKTIDFIKSVYGNQEFTPLAVPVFAGNEKKYLNECIDTTFVSSVGKFVDRFEEDMAKYTGAKKAVVCVSGTNALHMSLLLVGVKQDDEVLTQALTFIATCNALSYIGAHAVFIDVDRSTMGTTLIKKGVKLDNLVQVAHNVEIGENTVMSAQVGIAGSTKVGSWCMFGGQVGLAGHITIGDKTFLGAQSGVPGSLKGGEELIGTPPMAPRSYFKSQAIFRRLPEMYKDLQNIKKDLQKIMPQE